MFVPGNTQYGIWMRAPSSSGRKDWIGFLTDREVISQWGKTGQVNQCKVIGPAPSRIFLNQKIEEKRGKGYRVVGEWFPGSGWSHERKAQPPPQPNPPSQNRPAAATPPLNGNVMREWLSDQNSEQWF
ncbi:hypothetical protein [Geomesophilobacter sediminis]|uniref:Uncharacterized protein n=1 Tax=Geomesophilobacter sediminis TaxID=2798584 RepID=A0A8J7J5W8_9BACT|nr:hypothetical protein [Geomesophilobacter sediminis]MBJ6726388.1 hypothetical protein [Geomesophilobacter sediminis]